MNTARKGTERRLTTGVLAEGLAKPVGPAARDILGWDRVAGRAESE